MKITDGLRLATTKLLQKKVGSCLSGCVVGFSLVTLLLFIVIGSGLQRTVKGLYRDTLYKRYFGTISSDDPDMFKDVDKYKDIYKKYGIKEVYKDISIYGIDVEYDSRNTESFLVFSDPSHYFYINIPNKYRLHSSNHL